MQYYTELRDCCQSIPTRSLLMLRAVTSKEHTHWAHHVHLLMMIQHCYNVDTNFMNVMCRIEENKQIQIHFFDRNKIHIFMIQRSIMVFDQETIH